MEKKIYLIAGKAKTGKGMISQFIKEEYEKKGFKVCEIQMMRTLKGYLKDYFDWDGREETKPRKMLQEMGTEIIREKLKKPYFHIDRLTEDISILSEYFDIFIVNDVRLPIEIDEIKKRFSDVVSMYVVKKDYVSPLIKEEQMHITETALDDYENFDYLIINHNPESVKNDIIRIVGKEV